jgi:hypothetical protein
MMRVLSFVLPFAVAMMMPGPAAAEDSLPSWSFDTGG